MKDQDIISNYHKIVTKASTYKHGHLLKLNNIREWQAAELEIAVRLWHKIEEEYIRLKLETTIDMIDILEWFNFTINK